MVPPAAADGRDAEFANEPATGGDFPYARPTRMTSFYDPSAGALSKKGKRRGEAEENSKGNIRLLHRSGAPASLLLGPASPGASQQLRTKFRRRRSGSAVPLSRWATTRLVISHQDAHSVRGPI